MLSNANIDTNAKLYAIANANANANAATADTGAATNGEGRPLEDLGLDLNASVGKHEEWLV
jgi:hypothetical protein